jgi:hypothetical protein
MTFKHRKNQAMADDRNQKNGYLFGKDIDWHYEQVFWGIESTL